MSATPSTCTFYTYTKEQQALDAAERNAAFEAKHGRPMNYEDVIKSFGGRFVGQSIIASYRRPTSGSVDDGLIRGEQT